jgi:hypothetical protein
MSVSVHGSVSVAVSVLGSMKGVTLSNLRIQYLVLDWGLVFKGPVRSGLLPSRGLDRDRDRSS